MRFQITFTQGPGWIVDPHAENLERAMALTRPPYGAEVEEVCLPAHFKAYASGSPFRERAQEERAVSVAMTLEALAHYCADHDVVASMVAQSEWDIATDGEVFTHHIFISDPAPPSGEPPMV